MKKINSSLFFLLCFSGAFAQIYEPIPMVSFTEITINLSFPEYQALRADGGFIEIEGGVRGIIVHRINAETFVAYERDCPYKPHEACARVDVDMSRIFLIDKCCNSRFTMSDGNPMSGPAAMPLRRYHTMVAGNRLIITDEIDN